MPPLVLLGLGCLTGVAVWPALQPTWSLCLLGAVAACALSLIPARRPVSGAATALAGLCIGLSFPARLPAPLLLVGEGTLRGHVVTAANGRDADVAVATWEGADGILDASGGRVRIRFPDVPPPPGSAVILSGKAADLDLTHLPGEPDPAWDAARASIVTQVRAREVVRVGADPPEPRLDGASHAGLLRALVDGQRGGIPEEEARLLRRTGTWHLISISGLHIGLAALAGWWLAWGLSRPLVLVWRRGGVEWICAVVAVAAALAYTDLAGWPVPAVRACWMCGIAAVCRAVHRLPGPWEALALALIATLYTEPGAVAAPGFQLSFGAMAGMTLLSGRVTRWVPPDAPRLLRWFAEVIGASVGATVGTLPVTAHLFQDLSPLSAIANAWAVPWIGTVATPLLLASQLVPGSPGAWCLWLADHAVTMGLWGLERVDIDPWHPAVGPIGATLLAVIPLTRRREWLWVGLTALVLSWRGPARSLFAVTFLSIGQGDGALVEWPDGQRWLIDGGPAGDDLLHYLRRRGIDRLDRVFLSHPHPDHYGGLLPVLASLPVGELWVPRLPAVGESDFAALLQGQTVRFPGTPPTRFTLLHPLSGWQSPARDPVNDESLVLRLGWGRRRFLFTGDIEGAGEAAVAAAATAGAPLTADVLKVPHHGSATSSSPTFVAAVDPEIAVISCGWDNRYRHPRPQALASYRGVRVLRTDLAGTVTIRTDGENLLTTFPAPPHRWMLRDPVRPSPSLGAAALAATTPAASTRGSAAPHEASHAPASAAPAPR